MRKGKTVSLPRPANKPRWNRTTLTITMHPSELEALTARAKACSMSLTAYVAALLASDPEDVPAIANRPRSIWSDLTRGAQESLLVAGRAAASTKAVEEFVAKAHAAGEMLHPGCACATCMAKELGDEQKGKE